MCLPANYTGEVRQLAQVRKETFIEPPVRRNRLWQADFSEFETNAGGTWNLGGVVDYWAKVNLACTVSLTKTSPDAITMLETALDHVEELLGVTWVEDLTDPDTGEIGKLRIVTDNGACFKSARFAAWVASKRHIIHIRTRTGPRTPTASSNASSERSNTNGSTGPRSTPSSTSRPKSATTSRSTTGSDRMRASA